MTKAEQSEWSDPKFSAIPEGVSLAMQSLCRERLKWINEHKTEIIEAFIAKHGFQPDETVMVEKRRVDGGWEWFITKRDRL